jgi:long-chain acyl-CoA synthetase
MLEELLRKTVEKSPSKTAIVYDRLRISYQDLYNQIGGLSQGLSSIGIQPGDCVAIILPNNPEFVISFYALAKINAIALLLNPLFKQEELSYYIQDSQVKAIITDSKRAEICQNIISSLHLSIELICIDTIDSSESLIRYFNDLILSETVENDRSASAFSGNAIYQYSSGSTGRPKRVCRTQYNLYHEVQNLAETAKINESDTILCIVPLYHAHGLGNCLLAALCNGGTLVILEPVLQNGIPVEVPFVFRRQRVLELLESETVTIFPAVPYIFDILAGAGDDISVNLSTLRLCFSAGNFLSQEIFDKFIARFGIPIRQLYGCTEAGSVSINLDENVANTSNSVGKSLKNVEITIINNEEKELPVETIGEIVIKSEALTKGYDNRPELNQQAFKNGCFLTGDLGKKDAAGRLYITGRKKLLIDTGGYKVDPIEIEDILMTHPQVQEAVVVGVPQANAGEIIKAAIVLDETANVTIEEMLSFCQERMASFKVPKIIDFIDEIPKSPLGKVLRKNLV